MNNNIADIEKALGIRLPGAYHSFLLQEQFTGERLVNDLLLLYGTDILEERNNSYQVQKYLPGYISIGDDSGGKAILLHAGAPDENVYMTGYGALDTGSLEVLATDFNTWVQQGFPLEAIREAPDVIAFRASDTFHLRTAWQEIHRALTQLEAEKAKGMELKNYLTQKRILQQQLKDFELQHAGKNYRL